MNNVGVIDTFLNTFTTYIDSGFGLIRGEVTYLSSTLIVIDITLAGLFWAWGADEDILQRLVKKTLYIGFFAFIITNFNNLSAIVFNSFAGLGLKAGGSSISTADFLRPGKLAQVGLDAGQPLLDAASQMMGFTSFFANFVQIAVLMVSWLLVLIAFFILAVQLFVTLIEFKLTTLAGFILIPFALFNKTAFLAEKVLGNIVASGVKVMVLAVIVGIGTGLFSQFTQSYAGGQPTIEQALSVVLAALAMLGLGIFGPGIATGLVSGAPQLGAGAAVGTGLAVAGTAMAGAGALGLAGRGAMAAASGTAAASRGGAAMAGGASSAHSLASAGRSGASGVAAGLGGVARAAASAAAAPMRRAAGQAARSMRESFSAGARSSFAATGGSSTMGSVGSAEVAADASTPGTDAVPAWARRMRRNQSMGHGAQAAVQALKSGDSHGGGHSVDLSGGE
ncbi:P-type conjugative transfer protein TrbL [Bradyrhizobium viridifuturi]|jgi:type IV secretion system protein TrbL|nr:P-type conjugative transfer protein TrbL [Bradyrhizobium viridifuturi]MBR1048644.1 P-type conjugative transfer protein TrbL [Bradyrhizobium viridifuturi]MBR1083747.1 P-type conjugative transfer protein TrbL [Bradyrhizobium viridifuturi]MBR1099211.1 P-type conjugative transfer protein TrbL [Bradyrhizobium viridifuturi]MBR1106367.1 P-type conjugative transfer protein TrbL [Bradyrhizobium viridifuturi]